MNFDNAQIELKNYVSQHNIWKLFLPIGELLIIVCHLFMIVSNFISFGVIEKTIVGILAYISIVMVLIKGNYKVLTIGLLLRVIDYALAFIIPIFNTHPRFAYSSLLYGLVWFLFLLAAFKKSKMSVNELRSSMSVKGMAANMNLNEAKNFNFNDVKKSAGQAYSNVANIMGQVKSELNHGQAPQSQEPAAYQPNSDVQPL